MLIDLVPEFLAALTAPDPLQAYHRYVDSHRSILSAYWHNYVLDLDSPHAESVILRALAAQRRDLHQLIERVDLAALADETLARSHEVLRSEEHTSELQSRLHLVCRLLLEKKNT